MSLISCIEKVQSSTNEKFRLSQDEIDFILNKYDDLLIDTFKKLYNPKAKNKKDAQETAQSEAEKIAKNKALELLTNKIQNEISLIEKQAKDKGKKKKVTNVKPNQVLVPTRFKDANGKFINLFAKDKEGKPIYYKIDENGRKVINEEAIPKEILKTIGYRIPTQGYSSMANIEIVGFLPPNMNHIVAPRDFVKQMGLDYDIDKLYMYAYNTTVDENGHIKRLQEVKEEKPIKEFNIEDLSYAERVKEYKKYGIKKSDGTEITIDDIKADPTFYQNNTDQTVEKYIASEKTIRDLAARIADRIGINVRYESDRTKNYKGKLEGNTAVINLAHATLDTPIHEILGHPIIRTIRDSNVNKDQVNIIEALNYFKGETISISKSGYIQFEKPGLAEELDNNFPIPVKEASLLKEILGVDNKSVITDRLIDQLKGNIKVTSELYQNLLKELEYGKGKEVLDRVKRDYKYKNYFIEYPVYDNVSKQYAKESGAKFDRITEDGEAVWIKQNEYSLEEQQEEAIVELLGLYTADRLDKVKDGKLISLLKRLLKEIKAFMRQLLTQKEVEIDKLPDNITLGDLADLLAYSNSKLILPTNEVVYTTPDNKTFKTYAEANNHISELVKSIKDIDLSKINISDINNINNINNVTPNIELKEQYFKLYDSLYRNVNEISNRQDLDLEGYLDLKNNNGIFYGSSELNDWITPKLAKSNDYYYLLHPEDNSIITKISEEEFNRQLLSTNNSLNSFIERNKEYEQSKEIIEEWKKVNNIQYNPEEVYSRGQEFVSVLGAYSDFDVNLMLQNLLTHIEDNEKAGGEFTISTFTKPVDKKIGHLEGIGGKIKFKIYPQSKDIKWAANTDVFSGSVWDASKKVSKNKESELLGVSYTKYPSLSNVNSVQPNLASIIDNLAHYHNELGITLTGNNFRLEYDDNIPYTTKKIIDSVNSILDQKYGKLNKPEIKEKEKDINEFTVYSNGFKQGIAFKDKNSPTGWSLKNESGNIKELSEEQIAKYKPKGIEPTQTNETLKEDITRVEHRMTFDENQKEYYIKQGNNLYPYADTKKEAFELAKNDDFFNINEPYTIEENISQKKKHRLNKEYTSQALINTKIAKLKEVAKKYPRSLIRSEVKKYNYYNEPGELPFQLLPKNKLTPKQKLENKIKEQIKLESKNKKENINKRIEELQSEIVALNLKQNFEDLNKEQNENIGNRKIQIIQELNKLKAEKEINSRNGRRGILENELLDIELGILENPEVFKLSKAITSSGELETLAKDRTLSEKTPLLSHLNRRRRYKESTDAATGIGVFATSITFISSVLSSNQDIHKVIRTKPGKNRNNDLELLFFKEDPTNDIKGTLNLASNFLNAAVDNENNPILGKLKINKSTFSATEALIMMGYDAKTITTFMSNPTVVRYVEEVTALKDRSNNEFITDNVYDKAFVNVLDELSNNQVEKDDVIRAYALNHLGQISINEDLKKNDLFTKGKIMNMFNKLNILGENIRNIKSSLNLDSKHIPPSLLEASIKETNITNVKNSPLIELFKDTIPGFTSSILYRMNDLYQQLYPYNNDFIKETLNLIESISGKSQLTKDNKKDIIDGIRSFVFSGAVNNLLTSGLDLEQERYRLFFGNDNITKRVNDARRQYPSNIFLQSLRAVKKDGEPALVTFNNSVAKGLDESYFHDGFTRLLLDSRTLELGEDLIKATLLSNPSPSSPTSYTRFIPIEYLQVTGVINDLKAIDIFSTKYVGNFIEQFLQHNPKYAKEVNKNHLEKEYINENTNVPFFRIQKRYLNNYINSETEQLTKYLSIRNPKTYKTNLYKLIGNEYVMLPELGFGKLFTEFSYDITHNKIKTSFIPSNLKRINKSNREKLKIAQDIDKISLGVKKDVKNYYSVSTFISGLSDTKDLGEVLNALSKQTKDRKFSAVLRLVKEHLNTQNIDFSFDDKLEAKGRYRPSNEKGVLDKITINPSKGVYKNFNEFAYNVLHESLHALTSKIVNKYFSDRSSLTDDQKKLVRDIESARIGIEAKLKAKYPKEWKAWEEKEKNRGDKPRSLDTDLEKIFYGVSNSKELITAIFTSDLFLEEVSDLTLGEGENKKSWLEKIWDIIVNFISSIDKVIDGTITPKNDIEKVISSTISIIKSQEKDFESNVKSKNIIEPEYVQSVPPNIEDQIAAFESFGAEGQAEAFEKLNTITDKITEKDLDKGLGIINNAIIEIIGDKLNFDNTDLGDLLDGLKKSGTSNTLKGFINHSGGAIGADSYWEKIGKKYGIDKQINYRPEDLDKLSTRDLINIEEVYTEAASKLGREILAEDTFSGGLVRRNYLQVANSEAIYAISRIIEPGKRDKKGYLNETKSDIVEGGTGYAVQMAIDLNKPVYVFDQDQNKWFKPGIKFRANSIPYKGFIETSQPILTKNFAGIGTREINENGKKAIEEIYKNTIDNTIDNSPLDRSNRITKIDHIITLEHSLKLRNSDKDLTRKKHLLTKYNQLVKKTADLNRFLRSTDTGYYASIIKTRGEKGDNKLYYAIKINSSEDAGDDYQRFSSNDSTETLKVKQLTELLHNSVSLLYGKLQRGQSVEGERKIREQIKRREARRDQLAENYTIMKAIEVGEKDIADIERQINDNKLSETDIINTWDLLKTWSKIDNILIPETSRGKIVKDVLDKLDFIKGRATSILNNNFSPIVKRWATEKFNMSEDELFSIIRSENGIDLGSGVKDIDKLQASIRGANMTKDNPLFHHVINMIREANTRADEEIANSNKKIDEAHNKFESSSFYKLHKYTPFVQKDEKGNPTGNFINRTSDAFYRKREELKMKAEELASTGNYSGWKNYIKFLQDEQITLNVNELFTIDENDEIKYTPNQRYIDSLMEEYKDQDRVNDLIEDAKRKIESYKHDLEAEKEWLKNEDSEVSYELRLDTWKAQNNPFENSNRKVGSGKQEKVNYKYIVSSPKAKWNDKNFDIIRKDKDAYEFYRFYISTMQKFLKVAPDDLGYELSYNYLPYIPMSFMETVMEKGFFNGVTKVPDLLKELYTQRNLGILSYTSDAITKDIQGDKVVDRVEYDLRFPFGEKKYDSELEKELKLKNQSFDFRKILKIANTTVSAYKHKKRIEEPVKITERLFKQQIQIDKQSGNLILNSNGTEHHSNLANLTSLMDFTLAKTYFNVSTNPENLSGKKVLTSDEKKLKAEYDKELKEAKTDEEREKIKEKINKLGAFKSVDKAGRSLLLWVQLKAMAFNVFSGLSNSLFGWVGNYIHSAGNEDFSKQDFLNASGKVMQAFGGIMLGSTLGGVLGTLVAPGLGTIIGGGLGTILSPNFTISKEGKKVLNILKEMKVDEIILDTEVDSRQSITGGRRNLLASMYEIQRRTELFIRAQTVISMMLAKKVNVNGKEMSLYEATGEDGKFNFDKDWIINEDGTGGNEAIKFKLKAKDVLSMIHGNYDKDTPIQADKNVFSKAAMQFRRWLPEAAYQRFQSEGYSYNLERTVRGRWRSLSFTGFRKALINAGSLGIWKIDNTNLRVKTDKDGNIIDVTDETDIANIRKVSAEMTAYLIVTGLVLALQFLGDDDDDDDEWRFMRNFALNQLFRVQSDILFYINPIEAENILRNFIPAASLVSDFELAISRSLKYMNTESPTEREIDAFWNSWAKTLPAGSAVSTMRSAGKQLFD